MKTNNTLKKTVIASLMALTFIPALAQAGAGTGTFEPVSSNDKLVHIRPAGSTGQTNALKVGLRTEKNSYRVNEKIRFQVKTNKRVFVYMFNLDPRTGQALLILPNRLQTKNQIQYPGDNSWHLLPNASLEFFADRSGVERILMVASEKYIDMDKKLKSLSNTKSVGDFYLMDDPLSALDVTINDAYNAGASADKLVRIRSSKPTSPSLPKGVVVTEVNLRIR